MFKLKIVSLLSLTLLLAGCFATSPQDKKSSSKEANLAQNQAAKPNWVNSLPTRAGYAYGVSSAEVYGSNARALEDAKKQATAELLASIRVEITSQTDYAKSATMEFQGNTRMQENFNQKISSKVPKVELSGIQIKETWTDDKNKQAWALAELNISQATLKLLDRLNQLDDSVLERGMKTSGSKLDRIRYIKPSLLELAERNQIIQHLVFLSATTQIDALKSKNVEYLSQEIANLLASLGIRLISSNSHAKNLEATLGKSLTDLGFNLTTSNPDLFIELDANANNITTNGLYITNAQGSGQIKTPDGRTLQLIKSEAKEVSGNQAVANSKASEALGKNLADQLFETLYINL